MAGEQKRKARAVLITKALLLGYTIERSEWSDSLGRPHFARYYLVRPDGMPLYKPPHAAGFRRYELFPAPWVAAKKALELAGVLPDAKNSR